MRICIHSSFFNTRGLSEPTYSLFKNGQKLGTNIVISGLVEKFVSDRIPVIGTPKEIKPDEKNPFISNYFLTKRDVDSVDLFVFYFESINPYEKRESPGKIEEILSIIPKRKRVVFDADGKYNPRCEFHGDSNLVNEEVRLSWKETIDDLSDVVLQPTAKPLSCNIIPFLFWGYSDAVNRPDICLDLLYWGANWFRQDRVEEFMNHIKSLRALFPRVAVFGNNWITPDTYAPKGANNTNPEFYLRNNIKLLEKIAEFGQFTQGLGRARFSPILIRPILSYMKMFTPRMLETFASGTTPILPNYFDYAEALYGPEAEELRLGDDPEKKLRDMAVNEPRYIAIANRIRDKLKREHNYRRKIMDLLKIGGQL